MNKLTKGPSSLTSVIGKELAEEQPPWDTIQPQAKEFVQLASAMAQHQPPKGTKESWEDLTSAYTTSAIALDKAAEARDREAARAAHRDLSRPGMPP
jgi:hypothetical protein